MSLFRPMSPRPRAAVALVVALALVVVGLLAGAAPARFRRGVAPGRSGAAIVTVTPTPAVATPTPAAARTGVTPVAGPGTPAIAHTQTIVAVGDSITKGDWDTSVDGGWVTRLGIKLHAAYPGAGLVVRNAGVDGDTTSGVLARLARDVLAPRPRLVIVSIGTNDFDEHVPLARFAAQLRTLAERLRAAPGGPVVILASMLPIAAQTPARLAEERAYNDIIRRTASATDVGYLDLFDPWLALGDTLMRTLRHDTEHSNPIGYELLASTTAAFLEASYLDAHGTVVAPATPPTCSAALCGD